MVYSHGASPSGSPGAATFWVPERIGRRPVCRADRVGVHWFCTLKLVKRMPSAAKESMRGVGTVLPWMPMSPQPQLSTRR